MKRLLIVFLINLLVEGQVNANIELDNGFPTDQAGHVGNFPKEIHRIILSMLTCAEDLEKAADNIKSAMLTSTGLWHSFLQDITFVDSLIKTLVNKYDQSTDNVIDALGPEITSNLIDRYNDIIEYFLDEKSEILEGTIIPLYSCYQRFPFCLKYNYVRWLVEQRREFHVDMVDIFGRTPLMYAVFEGDFTLVKKLISRGTNQVHKDKEDLSPWTIARIMGYENIYLKLLEHDEEDTKKYNEYVSYLQTFLEIDQGRLVLDISIITLIKDLKKYQKKQLFFNCVRYNHLFLVQLIIDCDIDVNIQDYYDNTALMYAAKRGHVYVVQALINAGADVNVQSHYGCTALRFATDGDYVDVVQVLLDAGADCKTLAK